MWKKKQYCSIIPPSREVAIIGEKKKMSTQEKKPTILIVDDNVPNLELFQAYLESIDCETVLSEDGYDALEKAAQKAPDLIILDIMMPRLSGFEVCKRLKSNPQTSNIPVIVVTALSEFGDIERAINYGADDFLSKPVNKLELTTRVRTMLKISALTDKLERTLMYISEIESKLNSKQAARDERTQI